MARRGRRQLQGLRFHKSKGQWYRLYDGRERYFGRRGLSRDDEEAKAQAEREWHHYEAEISVPKWIPSLTLDGARAELLQLMANYGDPDDEAVEERITDEVVGRWHCVAGDRQAQREMLIQLGADGHHLDNDPDVWEALNDGHRTLNPVYRETHKHKLNVFGEFSDGPVSDGTPRCREIVDYYLSFLQNHKAPCSYVDAHAPLAHWLKEFGKDTTVGSLKLEDFVAYRTYWWNQIDERLRWETTQPKPIPQAIKKKAPGKSPETANKHIRLIKAAFNRYKRDRGLDVRGLADGLAALQQKGGGSPTDLPIFEREHIRLLLSGLDLYWQTICTLALNMAASNTDIDGVQWHHVDFESGILDFPRTKNNRPRRIPLWRRTLDTLEAYRRRYRSTSYIFLNRHGGRLITYGKKTRTDNLSVNFRKHTTRIGLRQSFAAFRKSTSTVAMACGFHGETILMILGDAPKGMWARYVRAVPEVVADATAAVEEHYFGGMTREGLPNSSESSDQRRGRRAERRQGRPIRDGRSLQSTTASEC